MIQHTKAITAGTEAWLKRLKEVEDEAVKVDFDTTMSLDVFEVWSPGYATSEVSPGAIHRNNKFPGVESQED